MNKQLKTEIRQKMLEVKKKEIKKILKIKIEWRLLERIAEFYEFPVGVFLSNFDNFREFPKTRKESLQKKAEMFDKIKEIIEDDV